MATKSVPTAPRTATLHAAPAKKSAPILAGNAQPDSAARKSTLAMYESALKLLQAGKFEKAHESFLKMLSLAPPDLAASIRRNIAICVDQLSEDAASFADSEERYDYAVSLLNQGHYEDARDHLQAILDKNKSADYAFYGLALLASMTGSSDKCLEHLAEAIRLNPQYRFQARLDSDFDSVAEDPRFTELLYPEA